MISYVYTQKSNMHTYIHTYTSTYMYGPPGPLWASLGPLGRALVGQALVGTPWALVGPHGPLWGGPLWAPWTLVVWAP